MSATHPAKIIPFSSGRKAARLFLPIIPAIAELQQDRATRYNESGSAKFHQGEVASAEALFNQAY
ncbi:MAG: hypothetical protein HY692_06645 [Cyanobacteria bacterium NC_groundwater_1444_Ag_S-0.65um_54_12]|nr:hypothetical protein [Cyanobacteria bacterium NC_groundwater_1444_Ag_S-0.65um_54_12]